MISNTESYIDKPYLSKYPSIATSLVCCAVLSYGGVGNCLPEQLDKIDKQYGYNQEVFHEIQPSTWVSLDNISNADFKNDSASIFDALTSFDVIKKLSFMAVDEEADKRIEDYFASTPIKTRTIFENHRIKKG
jgi:hypothetical protein